jgi:NAD+ synthase (glutamine-hydrolysing)
MRLALAQTNPVVGDLAANRARILDMIRSARDGHADLVVFPELALVGYPPKDLLLKPSFIDDAEAALQSIARDCTGITAIVGYPQRNLSRVGRPLYNAAAVLAGGAVASRHFKTLLPTYDVFDESRYFQPAPDDAHNVVAIAGTPVGISICEDLWNDPRHIAAGLYDRDPIGHLHRAGARLILNLSASPFVLGKHDFRLDLFASQARAIACPLVYVNQVGGNDELLFDGNSLVLDAAGKLVAHGKDFAEDLVMADLGSSPPPIPPPHRRGLASLHAALVMGLRDYCRKCGFKSAVLGLSGGIDSALTAALAVDALGPDKVVGVAMPSRFSSDHSIEDARILARNLGIEFHLVPISAVHDAYEATLAPAFASRPRDITEENLQARVRGGLLMAMSNKFNHLLLTTGNKSEVATGYCTLYGDMCGGLAVISDVPKTTVWDLSRYHNQFHNREIIPQRSIDKVPSAELRPNQTDQDSLPPYDLLDAILHRYIEEEKGHAQITAEGFDPDIVRRVIRLVDRSEYKRRQAAPGLKVTSRAFGSGRRMPIAMNYNPT